MDSNKEAVLLKIIALAATEHDLEKLSYAAASVAHIAETAYTNNLVTQARGALVIKLRELIDASNDLESISYATSALSKLEGAVDDQADEVFTIGTPGQFGFGVSALRDHEIPDGWTAFPGHQDRFSPNYGNYLDPHGSHMVFIRKCWTRWNGNTPEFRNAPASGFTLDEAFRHTNLGFMRDKTHVSNVNGVACAKIGLAPLSTSGSNNGISQLDGVSTNNYANMVTALKLRGSNAHAETVFEATLLAKIALAHSLASTNTIVCAYKDVLPHMPKGNNNNALRDVNDASVRFISAGISGAPLSALTGSATHIAKTAHNGQACGVLDVNGNLWRVNLGLTKAGETDAIFRIFKTTTNPNDITTANLHAAELYDEVDLSDLMPSSNQGWISLGNGVEQVYDPINDVNDVAFRVAAAGIPLATGVSSAGTNQFGAGFFRFWRNNLMPLSGGNWNTSSNAGAFARNLNTASSLSSASVGGAACVSL